MEMEKKEYTIMSILKPIIRVNQFFGVCPHEISGDIMIFRYKSLRFLHTLFTLIILSLYFIYMLFQLILSFPRGRPIPEIASLALYLGGTLVPISMLVVTIIKRNQFTLFFEKMWEYKAPLKGVIQCENTIRFSRKVFVFYIFLCFLSCIFVTCSTIMHPRSDISIVAYYDDEPSTTMVAVACIFQCYLVILNSCAIAFIEILCSSMATSFVHTVKKIKEELQKSLDGLSPRFQRPFNKTLNNRFDGGYSKQMKNDPHVRKIQEQSRLGDVNLYPVIPNVGSSGNSNLEFSLKPYTNTSSDGFGNNYSECVIEGAAPIILAIRRYNCITNMQRLINCIFGQLLALDTGFLVFMSCLLFYLQINYLGSRYVDKLEGAIFSGNSIIFFFRLLFIFITLGDVHDISVCFNGVLTSSLMQVKKPKPQDVNLILAHLSTHSANPVSYSAGGFFIFSKSSLLAVLSVIMTYVVFLLQARN